MFEMLKYKSLIAQTSKNVHTWTFFAIDLTLKQEMVFVFLFLPLCVCVCVYGGDREQHFRSI